MRKVYFFSDAHLGLGTKEEDRAKERLLVLFLDQVAADGEELFIVGDLFDFWFEYKSVVPKGYYRLFAKLAELHERGIRITYLAGNHDFWLRGYFHDEFGMQVYPDPIERTIRGKRFYIGHGDGLLKNDAGYRILKRVLRNRTNIFLFSLVHPDLASSIARWSSRASRKHTAHRSYEESDMAGFAEAKIRGGCDYVVLGHNHAPLVRNFGTGIYVNLGDWISSYTYAVFDGKRLELKHWTGNQPRAAGRPGRARASRKS